MRDEKSLSGLSNLCREVGQPWKIGQYRDEGTPRLRRSQKKREDTARAILLTGARSRNADSIVLTGLVSDDPPVCEHIHR
jgi:hypothetical protein